jgi:TusA-related sulfurtransferase
MKNNEFIEINCLGDICPVPIIKLKKCENELSEGMKIMLVTDHSCTAESVKNYCASQRLKLKIIEPINGVWEMYISKKPKSMK